MKTKTWFITGASQGIGFALMEQVLKRGDNVVATTRNAESLRNALTADEKQLLIVSLDLRDEKALGKVAVQAVNKFGSIDYLVNNAGYGLLGGVEEISDVEARANFDINVFGLLNGIRAVLPQMRQQQSGHIFNISSVFGLIAGTGWGIYCATKFAVEGLSEALEQEVKPFGIKVTLIEPGYFRTNFLQSGSLVTAMNPIEDYKNVAEVRLQHIEQIPGNQPGDPAKAATVIINTSLSENPPLRLLLGSDAVEYATYKLKLMTEGIAAMRDLSISTDFTS